MRTPAGLIGGYASDTLDQGERRQLFEAACEDQDIFDALMDEEPLRELLRDPATRRALLAASEEHTFADQLRMWFRRPATLGHLAVATSVALVAVTVWLLIAPWRHPDREAARSPDSTDALFALPLTSSMPATLEGDPPSFRLTVGTDARVVAVEKKPNGTIQLLFPLAGSSSAVAHGGIVAMIGSLEAGVHRVRVIVCPPDIEPLSPTAEALLDAQERLTVIERRYVVTKGGKSQ